MELALINPTITSIVSTTLFTQSISDTSRKILDLVENIFNYGHDIQEIFNDTDIQATLKTLDEFVKEIDDHNNKTIHIALDNLNNIIEELHTVINQIQAECEYHKTKYFSSYRKLDLSEYCNIIKKKNKILDKRFHLLIQLLQTKNMQNYIK